MGALVPLNSLRYFIMVVALAAGALWSLVGNALAAGGEDCAAKIEWVNGKVNCTTDRCANDTGSCDRFNGEHTNVTPWTYNARTKTWSAGAPLLDHSYTSCSCKLDAGGWGQGIYGVACCDVGLTPEGHFVTIGKCNQCPITTGTCKPSGTMLEAEAVCEGS